MSKHTKHLTAAVMAAALGILGSQASADVALKLTGNQTVTTAGIQTYTLSADFTNLTGVDSVAIWDVVNYLTVGTTGDVTAPINATFTPTSNFSLLAGNLGGTAAVPLYLRSAAVSTTPVTIGAQVYYPPVGAGATVTGGNANITLGTIALNIGFTTGGTVTLGAALPTTTLAYPNMVWSQTTGAVSTAKTDYTGVGADSNDNQVIGLPSLNITVGGPAGNILHVGAGQTVTLAANTVVDGVDIDPTGKLDIGEFALIIKPADALTRDSQLAQVSDRLHTGFAGYAWSGDGIISSHAANDPSGAIGVGYLPAGDWGYTEFLGATLDENSIIVKSAYYGDADLSGLVTPTDYSMIDSGSGASLVGWQNGEFAYGNAVGPEDYSLIDSGAALSRLFTPFDGAYGPAVPVAAVPEPASLSLLGLAGFGLVLRRRAR